VCRLDGNGDALPVTVAPNDDMAGAADRAISFDHMRMLQHLKDLLSVEAVCPKLVLILVINDEVGDADP
jgi:hypothetical protein